MIRILAFALAAALPLAPAWAAPQTTAQPSEDDRLLVDLEKNIIAHDANGVIAVADKLMALHEGIAAQQTGLIYSADNPQLALAYALMGATEKKSVVVMGRSWAVAPFAKGFVLIDLGRRDEALPYLKRAVALSPLSSQYLAELAEWYKGARDWDQVLDLFRKAEAATTHSSPEVKQRDLMRAKRGVGFALIEKGQLDEAATIFRECLAIDPNDEKSKNELAYIAEMRGKGMR